MNKENQKIGQMLLEQEVPHKYIEEGLKEQVLSGEKIGKILFSKGVLNAKQLYSSLAEQSGMEFVDFLLEDDELHLLKASDRDDYLQYGAMPWKIEGGRLVVALSEINDKTLLWINKKYGDCDFVMTSPHDIEQVVNNNFAEVNTQHACDALWSQDPTGSAKQLFSYKINKFDQSVKKILIALSLCAFLSLLFFPPVFIVVNIFYFLTLFFKAVIFLVGSVADKYEKRIGEEQLKQMKGRDLPIYTLLIPLFKEKDTTISQLVGSINNLNYPKTKLDIKLIVEADDSETIANIKSIGCGRIFDIVKVPYSYPQTKPKALNYALRFAKGEYVTIYDAEDRPQKQQLREAVYRFRSSSKDLACLQGRLNYYNRNENILTRMFAFEYGGWFDFLLPGLKRLNIPIPLGGTSNHFPIKVIRELLAWDPYNVTEDADLGLRLAAKGYKSEILQSRTFEEAPIQIKSWLNQRSRWIKGHLQTFIVHSRGGNDSELYNSVGTIATLSVMFFLTATCVVFLTLPFVLLASIILFYGGSDLPAWFIDISVYNLICSIAVHVVCAVAVVVKHGWWKMLPYTVLFPFYWILHSISSFKAFWQLFLDPHYWEKTEHGVTTVKYMDVEEKSIA